MQTLFLISKLFENQCADASKFKGVTQELLKRQSFIKMLPMVRRKVATIRVPMLAGRLHLKF
jgi:hypothetical protein